MFNPATEPADDFRVIGVNVAGVLRHRRLILRVAWIVGVIVVIVGSLLPGDSAPIRALDGLDVSDKVEHFAAYAALAFLPAIHERRRTAVILALGLVGLGVLLEFGQLLSATRDFEIGDMVADTAGVAVGLLTAWPLRRSIAKRIFRSRSY